MYQVLHISIYVFRGLYFFFICLNEFGLFIYLRVKKKVSWKVNEFWFKDTSKLKIGDSFQSLISNLNLKKQNDSDPK